MIVRPAAETDLARISEIWAPVIHDSTITFASDDRPPEAVARLISDRRAAGHEFFVAEVEGRVAGFATYAQFRGGNGYVTSMEHSIILAPEARGRGAGRALMRAVETHARDRGAHTMVAVVSAENPAGVAFHAACGYQTQGTLREVGRKFGRWLDAVFMVKIL
jgi:phosphinothricin acetyltransferase